MLVDTHHNCVFKDILSTVAAEKKIQDVENIIQVSEFRIARPSYPKEKYQVFTVIINFHVGISMQIKPPNL